MKNNRKVDEYIERIIRALIEISSPQNAKSMKKYMKDNFEFLGIKARPRRKASREYMKKAERPDYDRLDITIKKMWQLTEREYQYFATELLVKYEREYQKDIIKLFEYIITHKSWWDTVDMIAKKLVGTYFKKFPVERDYYIDKWVKSDNMWLQRTTLLFQLAYKEDTDIDLLFSLINKLKDIDEFFIKKAIGWSLREYSKIDPEIIKIFIANNKLSSLSSREGLKVIMRNN